VISILITVFAFFFVPALYAGEFNNVKDDLNLITEDQSIELQRRIGEITEAQQLDVVIRITDNTEGKSSMACADDYYDYNGYGVGSESSGLILLLNMKDREIWISTRGGAIDIFTDQRINAMVGTITPFMGDQKYFEACGSFLDQVIAYAEAGVPEGAFRKEGISEMQGPRASYRDRLLSLVRSPLPPLVSLVIALILTVVLSLSRKGKVTITNRSYEAEGSFKLTATRDDYLRESTTRRKIEKESSSSSTHTSSSGSTHGGGGGKF